MRFVFRFAQTQIILLQARHFPTPGRHRGQIPRTGLFLLLYGLPQRSPTPYAIDRRHL